jgi:hypothetical protein
LSKILILGFFGDDSLSNAYRCGNRQNAPVKYLALHIVIGSEETRRIISERAIHPKLVAFLANDVRIALASVRVQLFP